MKKTIIDHKKRNKFSLTCDEYALIESIENFMVKNKIKRFLPKDPEHQKKVNNPIAFSDELYKLAGNSLINKGMLIKSKEGGFIIVPSWCEENEKLEQLFNTFWETYGKIGSKKNGLTMFKKALKKVDLEHLYERWEEYKSFLEESGQHQMHLSTWLNPDNERYNDEFKVTSVQKIDKKDEKQTVLQGSFYSKSK